MFNSQDDVSTEALKCLYGTSRANEIDDVVNNVSTKETNNVILDEDSTKKDNSTISEKNIKVPKFKEVVNYIWDQMQKRKKGSNAKHRFVISNQVLQFHPQTYQEVWVVVEFSIYTVSYFRHISCGVAQPKRGNKNNLQIIFSLSGDRTLNRRVYKLRCLNITRHVSLIIMLFRTLQYKLC